MGDHVHANGTSRGGGRKRPSNEDDLTEEEICKKLKNREAAKRCRLRKLEESKNLKQQNEDLENQNKVLTKKKMELEDKIRHCIQVIQQHQQHGCQLPDDVLGILNSDSERPTSSDEGSDFLPVGTIHGNRNMSSRMPEHETLPIYITEDNEEMTNSDSRIPTGLFSGTEIQMDQTKRKMQKSPSPVALAVQKKDMVTISDSHGRIQSAYGMPLKHINPATSQNGYSQVEDGEGTDQSSSPVQRVPNIDQVPWSSPSPKPNGVDESGDDEYSYGSRSDVFPQTVNLPSSVDKLCGGGYVLRNTQDPVAMVHMNVNHKTDNKVKPFQMIKNADPAPKPLLMSNQTKSFKHNKPSVTQSLQATTELISQAIHDIDPSEISQSFHAQIVECAKPDSASPIISMHEKDYLIPDSSSNSENQEEIPQEAHQQFGYRYENRPQQEEVIQNEQISYNIPVSFGAGAVGLYENVDVVNPNILQSGSLSSTITEIPGIRQNFIITDKSLEHPGQPQVVHVPLIFYNTADQFQQPSQPVEEIVENSQIPTTVFNVVEENEIPGSEQNASEKIVSSHVDQHALENTENVNVSSSTDNYSANVSELPSLSFNDLQNTPKEIFDKKPSRLRTK